MKKITTLFIKDITDLGRVINQIDPLNKWVFEDGVIATQKHDGTACAIVDGKLYKRYDVKQGKSIPINSIACQAPDRVSGHWPHWVRCERDDKSNKWHFEAYDAFPDLLDGTYELCGPKIQGNPEKLDKHYLIRHGVNTFPRIKVDFEYLKDFLKHNDIEGIVFHHPDGRMCKIRKSDFGFKR